MKRAIPMVLLTTFWALAAAPQTVPTPSPFPARIDIEHAPAPLFDDPIWHGASDPFVIWNPDKAQWFMYYTQRRASLENPKGVDWVHGSAIGIATSKDGVNFTYLDTAKGDHDLTDPMAAKLTFWAPCFVYQGKTLHMFVVQVDGIYTSWTGQRHILHYTSDDGLHFKYVNTCKLSSDRVIDPTVYQVGGGDENWYMVYKDEADKSHTWIAHSKDMIDWTADKAVTTDVGQEAPFTFHWKNSWWLIVDAGNRGLRIYKSPTGIDNFTFNNTLLNDATGQRPKDNTRGIHPGIVLQDAPGSPKGSNDQCICYYFTETRDHRSLIQVAELTLDADGKVQCDRNKYLATTPATKPKP